MQDFEILQKMVNWELPEYMMDSVRRIMPYTKMEREKVDEHTINYIRELIRMNRGYCPNLPKNKKVFSFKCQVEDTYKSIYKNLIFLDGKWNEPELLGTCKFISSGRVNTVFEYRLPYEKYCLYNYGELRMKVGNILSWNLGASKYRISRNPLVKELTLINGQYICLRDEERKKREEREREEKKKKEKEIVTEFNEDEEKKHVRPCGICMENKRSHCFDCGHVEMCGECIVKIENKLCPVCRYKGKTIIKVFI